MKRREFLHNSALASGMVLLPSFLKPLEFMGSTLTTNRNLVIVQLSGGCDGLNAIVPFRNDIYHRLRPKIALPLSSVININDKLGFNENLKGLANLHDKGYLSIINGVGYPNPNRSHFRSMDIWHTGSGSNQYWNSGWVGRYLDSECQHTHNAIDVDDALSLALKGEQLKGMAVSNPQILRNTLNDSFLKTVTDSAPSEMLDEHNMGYLYKTLRQTQSSAEYIFEKYKSAENRAIYPNDAFAKSMKVIARLIKARSETKVYYASLGGFDTHINQLGKHNRLLSVYGNAMEAFVNDLEKDNAFEDTVIFTFSEFGRRVKQNASFGTDHGSANNSYLIGKNLKKAGVFNTLPELTDLDDNGDLKYSIDFRQIYATLLNSWLGADDKAILKQGFEPLNLV